MPSPALLCDIGNVLVHFDFARAAARFAGRCALSEAEVLRALEPLKGPLESGGLAGSDFILQGIEAIRFTGAPDEFRDIWCDIFSLNAPMERLLDSLDMQVPMHLLSNTSDVHKAFLFDRFPVFHRFSGGVYSYAAGCMKPDERIFRLAVERLDLDPARTFYIDDLMPNIETARRIGFRTFHYSDAGHAALEATLRDWLAEVA